MTNGYVLPVQVPAAVLIVDGLIATGAAGAVPVLVPRRFCKLAVVCRPTASKIENTSGSTQVPLVIASKKPPLVATVELTKVTPSGKVDVTR
jgi:hypothetical protein